MSVAALIEKKIAEGKEILEGLSSMRERSGMAINVTYYVAEDVQSAIRKINKWQLTVKDILINGFGESHRYTESFVGTITNCTKIHYFSSTLSGHFPIHLICPV